MQSASLNMDLCGSCNFLAKLETRTGRGKKTMNKVHSKGEERGISDVAFLDVEVTGGTIAALRDSYLFMFDRSFSLGAHARPDRSQAEGLV